MHSKANGFIWQSRLLLSAALVVTSSFARDCGLVDNKPLEAIWHSRQFDLELQSGAMTYNCQRLGRRLAMIFRAVGARDGMSTNVRCSNGSPALPMLTAAAAFLGFGSMQAHALDVPDSVEVVWKSHQLTFEYRGYSTMYTCGILRNKLTKLLVNLGARRTPTFRFYVCDEGRGVLRLEVAFQSPVEATPENVRALTDFDSRERLIARMRGEQLPSAGDVVRFPAAWKTVSLASNSKLGLEPGDCELVQQLRQQILSRMSVQVVRGQRRCSEFGQIVRPRMTVSALIAEESEPNYAFSGSG